MIFIDRACVKYKENSISTFTYSRACVAYTLHTPPSLPLDSMSHGDLPAGAPVPAPSGSTQPHHAWRFNDRLNIITHEARTCETCTPWALHYMESVFSEDPSLRATEEQRNSSILASVTSENTSLCDNNEALRRELSALRSDLKQVRSTLDSIHNQLSCARD
jgi:hypothetical protein